MGAADWTPQDDEWAGGRRDLEHTGGSDRTSVFTDGAGGFAQVKWDVTVDFPVLYPPVTADLDRDGVKEVVVTPNDVKTQVGPPPDLSFSHKVEALSGADGASIWESDEANSFSLVTGANIVDLDGDDTAEVLYFGGNPVTGTSATNKFVALEDDGDEKWRWSPALDWGAQHPVGTIVATQGADVDDDDDVNEAVVGVVLADLVVDTVEQGAGCPNPNGQKVRVTASNLNYFIHALDGDDATPEVDWQKAVDPALIFSTPVIADLDGDGRRDVVWGSGTPAGILIPSCSAQVEVDDSAVDNRVIAIDGANPPEVLWESSFEDPVGVDRPIPATPVLAGTTAGGDPILVFLVPVPPTEPAANDPDRNIVLALNGRTGETLWTLSLRPASVYPLAAADLDDDGQPEIIAQLANRLVALRNDGTNFWDQGDTAQRGKAFARGLTGFGVAVGDLDSDGTKEIVTILDGSRAANQPKAELLVVNGADGSQEWTFALVQDDALGGPVLADVDGDDSLLEIVVASGSYTLGDNVDHTGRVIVLEPNAPDLTLLNVELIGDRVNREPQTVRATVKNEGTRDLAAAAMRLRVDGAAVAPDRAVDVAAGATETVDFGWTPEARGAHVLEVSADPGDAARELDETNNERNLNVNILARYDLSVAAADVGFTPAAPIVGEEVTVNAKVRNVGEVATPETSVLRFREEALGLSEDRTIPVLAPGALSELSVTFSATEERTHHLVVTADPSGALDEEREDNNEVTKDVFIELKLPDLSIGPADVTFLPVQPIVGDEVTVTATVRNIGDVGMSADAVLRFVEDALPLAETRTIPALAAGDSVQLSVAFTVGEERTHHLVVTADPDGVLDEEREDNNEALKDLLVGIDPTQPDLVAEALAALPEIADPGETVELSATFRNDGNKSLGGFTAIFFDGAAEVGKVTGPALGIGDSAILRLDWAATEPRDVHALRVEGVVTVPEPSVLNNVAEATVIVGTLAVLVAMDRDAFGPGEDVTGLVHVRFTGTALGVPAVPLVLDVFYRSETGAVVELQRARLEGVTGPDGQSAFEVPATLLGANTVCLGTMCPIDEGQVLGLGVHAPGAYRVLAHADRLGFDFHGEDRYLVGM